MNPPPPQSGNVTRPAEELGPGPALTKPLTPLRQTLKATDKSVRFKQPLAPDTRITSLKILALTLLNHIKSLEREGRNNESDELNLQTEVRRFEAELIRNALVETGGRQRRAARLLGMKVTTLNTKIRRYQIRPEHVD